MEKVPNAVLGLVAFFFGLLLLLVIIPIQVEESPFGDLHEQLGLEILPITLSVGIMGAGIVLFLSALAGHEPTSVDWRVPRRVLKAIVLMIAYYPFLVFLGYTIGTIITFSGLLWVFGERRMRHLTLVPVLVSLCLRWIFVVIFNVRLPRGMLF